MKSHHNGGVEKTQRVTRSQNRSSKDLQAAQHQNIIKVHATAPNPLSSGSLRLRERSHRAFRNSDDLLQAYIGDKFRSRRRELYINVAVRRFVSRARFPVSEKASRKKEILETVTKLAKHEAIFRRILDYANERTKRDFIKITYSTMKSMHTALMGVVVKPPVPFGTLAGLLEETTLPGAFAYPSRADVELLDFIDVFPEETEIPEMASTAETNARFRISTILKQIIRRMRHGEIVAVGEELSLGYCGDQVGPIEIQHMKGDGTVLSTFISGRLDYVCFKAPPYLAKKALKSKRANVDDALRSFRMETSFVGIRFDDFMENLEKNLNKALVLLGPLETDLPWQVFALEAKHMKERFSYKAGTVSASELDPVILLQDNDPKTPDNSDISNDDRGDHQPEQPHAPDVVNVTSVHIPRPVTCMAPAQTTDWRNLSPLQILVRNPVRWVDAYQQLQTLAPETFVDASILDQYLLEISSSQLGNFHARYIPFHLLRSTNPSDQEIANFRELAGLSHHTTSCPFETVFSVIHQFDHFYVVVVLPHSQEIHILGRGIQIERQYQDQAGWNYWRVHLSGIALYYGWDMSNYQVLCTDWLQNGFDCGPIACQVATFILRHGFNRNTKKFWAMPTLPCAHEMRRILALKISDETMENVTLFSSLLGCDDTVLLQNLYGTDLENMRCQIQDFENIMYRNNDCLEVLSQLDQKMLRCKSCRINRNRKVSSTDSVHEAPSLTVPSRSESVDGRVISDDSLDDIEVINMLLRDCSFYTDTSDESDELDESSPRLLSSGSVSNESQAIKESTKQDHLQKGGNQSSKATPQTDSSDHESEVTKSINDASDETDSDNDSESVIRRINTTSDDEDSDSPDIKQKASKPSAGSGKHRKATTQSPRDLTKHLPQVIGQCLAINSGIETESRRPEVIKFGISSSNDWLFGLLDCSDNTRLCYTTDTLTIRTEEDLKNMIFLLLTWMIVPGHGVLQHFPNRDT